MPREKGSVLYYTKATINIPVNFPENDVVCFNCPFCQHDSVGAFWCDILGKFQGIMKKPDAEHYKLSNCPLEFEEVQ